MSYIFMPRSFFTFLVFSYLLVGLVVAPQSFAYWVVTENGVVVNHFGGQVLGEKSDTRSTNHDQPALKIKVKDDQLELTTEGSTTSSSLAIEDKENKDQTKVRAQDNTAYVIRNKIAAQSHFPLMVNLETNELIVTTPKGTKVVTVLPDAAVQHMLAANVLDQLGGKGGLRWLEYQQVQASSSAAPIATDSATPTPILEATPSSTLEVVDTADNVVVLTTTNDGTLVYEIQGFKNKKLLGFKPIELPRTVIVSAETGELVQIVQNLKTRVLDLLSV